jgi:predicted NAD/FAD-binding protein
MGRLDQLGARRRSVAVIGAGVSGLVTAHLLADHHQVTVFEAEPQAGGHAHTVDIVVPDGGSVSVDVGFMVLNDRTYPRFTRLLGDLGVSTRVSDMSFSVSDGYDFEFGAHSVAALFANPRHLADRAFLRMVAEYAWFNRQARALLQSDADPSLRSWLEESGFSAHFIERLLVPQAAAVWSVDPAQMWTFPARFLVQFFANHGMLSFLNRPTWQTIVGGSRVYVDKIRERLGGRLRLGTPVCGVRRVAAGVEVTAVGCATQRFDDVVFACHSDQALALLEDPTPAEVEVLGAIDYQRSALALHRDDRLLPRRAAARASWNCHLFEQSYPGPAITYDLKRLQGIQTPVPILASLNVTSRIDPAKIFATFQLAHPIFTPRAVTAQQRHGEISGVRGVHYAGAYWSWGFHEDGVASAHRVANRLGAVSRAAVVVA